MAMRVRPTGLGDLAYVSAKFAHFLRPWLKQLARMDCKSLGMLRASASHICTGNSSSTLR